MSLYVSDYYLNSVLDIAFYHDVLSVNVPYIDLDTTVLDAALRNQLSKYGYEKGMPCKTRLYANAFPP